MASLIPQEALNELDAQFGERFRNLTNQLHRLILAIAYTENRVDHKRLREISTDHPSDISKAFTQLVRDGFLYSDGAGRGTFYFLPDSPLGDFVDTIGETLEGSEVSSIGSEVSSIGSEVSSIGSEVRFQGFSDDELKISAEARNSGKVNKHRMENIILALCEIRPQKLDDLSKLLNRSADFLSSDYMRPLIKQGKLAYKYKEKNHPEQAYTIP